MKNNNNNQEYRLYQDCNHNNIDRENSSQSNRNRYKNRVSQKNLNNINNSNFFSQGSVQYIPVPMQQYYYSYPHQQNQPNCNQPQQFQQQQHIPNQKQCPVHSNQHQHQHKNCHQNQIQYQGNNFQPFQQPQYNFSNKFTANPNIQNQGVIGNENSSFYGSFYKNNNGEKGKNEKKNYGKLNKPDPFKYKSPDQIVNEFKAYSLPKMRLKGLVKIQAAMRGYYVRKFILPKKKTDNRIMENYVDRLMKHYIEDKMIPDLVLEILTYNKYNEDVSLYSTEYRSHLEIMDKILNKVVKDIAQHTVRESTGSLIENILSNQQNKKSEAEKDPFALVLQDIIMNVVEGECKGMGKELVQETTQDYLSEIHLRQLIKDRFINKQVKEVVIDAIEEIIIEKMVDDMADKLTKELSQPLASRMYETVQQEVEAVELDKALDSYIYRQILDVVLENIGVQMDENNRKEKELEKQKKQGSKYVQ
ncbi:hypothetical protein PPERSA_09102 [Pseudocohnilembus persalinus]|uniref:Uncharacterized protein n=1 Tax=Pseudocohnilembus persalinus TaxID=266149 RepID=A0A0V0QWF9_PSEPJ|nr:hypothetical protein PPERSA_09102 [Pseudocohnilembus persalinus]|eukprot:KRX06700.1 hypothetical protein PPERSA_09102 [Pseudocohnilembus persalinus]